MGFFVRDMVGRMSTPVNRFAKARKPPLGAAIHIWFPFYLEAGEYFKVRQVCLDCKLVVSRMGEGYDAQSHAQNW